ncbi:MAG: nuclease-related domain-containing protein [Kiritimatiellia bacterium]
MAIQHGKPGEWAKVRGTVASMWPVFLSCALLGAFAASCLLGTRRVLFATLFLVSLVVALTLLRKGLRRVESYFKGARGEEHVAYLLSLLPDSYHVFHDYEAGVHHVDHVVVGPTGVYAIETKNWRGRVALQDGLLAVDGHLPSRSPTVQARAEAKAVKAVLDKTGDARSVVPVLCFASDSYRSAEAEIEKVFVVNAKDVRAWLQSRPETLSANESKRLVQLMETSL